jgi:molybdate transport system substrate-binding protein
VSLNVRSSETRRRALGANRISETQHADRSFESATSVRGFLPLAVAIFAQLDVITSVGFVAAYKVPVPAFQKSSEIIVATKHFASQGNGPDTVAAQLRAGAAADVVIMSKEGLGELVAEGRIIQQARWTWRRFNLV